MFDRFTDRSRKVMGIARQEAQRFNHQYMGSEHLLLALAAEGSGIAANVLRNLGVDSSKIMIAVEKLIQPGPTMVTMGQLPFTPRCKRVLELASESASNLRHNYIGTEHLLLGLLREREGTGAKALEDLGLKLEDVRREILEVLGGDDPVSTAPKTFDQYQEFTGSTAVYPGAGTGNYDAVVYCALKGAGECGEFAEKLGKRMRKQGSINAISRSAMDDEFRLDLAKELGDRLWYISQAATELGYTLAEIAQINVTKLTSRKDRGVIVGEGDNR